MKPRKYLASVRSIASIPFVRHATALSGPQALQIFARLGAGLVTAKILGPQNLGIVAAASLVYSYSLFVQFGALDGMGLKVPYARGEGNQELADRSIGTSYRFVLGAFVPYSLVAMALTMTLTGNRLIWLGVGCFIVAGFMTQVTQYREAVLRFSYRFRQLSFSHYTLVIATFVLTISLTVALGVRGTLLAAFLAFVPSLIYLTWGLGIKIPGGFSWRLLQELIALGMPVMIIGFTYTIYSSVDRYFIIGSLGVEKLGFYSIVLTLSSVALLVPVSVVSLLIQYLRELYGRTHDREQIWYYIQKFSLAAAVMVVPLCLVANEVAFLGLRGYLMEFRPSVPLVTILLLWSYLTIQFHILNAYLVITDQKRWALMSLAIGGLCAIGFNAAAASLGLGLEGIAWATALSSAVLALMLVLSIKTHGGRGSTWNALLIALGAGSFLLLPWLLDMMVPRLWEDTLYDVVSAVLIRMGVALGLLIVSLWVMRISNLWAGMGPLLRRSV